MVDLSKETIFNSAVTILLTVDHTVVLTFSEGEVSVRFPTTRRLAEHLDIPHYYVLPYFAEMERDGLIKRIERVGISTTPRGTQQFLSRAMRCHRQEAASVLGNEIFAALLTIFGSPET